MVAPVSSFSFDSVADNLISDGLEADKAELVQRLQTIGEHRFGYYAEYFRSGSSFRLGVTLDAVWQLYEFDHRLRSLCLEAIGNIETQIRSHLAYRFADQHGEFDYLNTVCFPNFSSSHPNFSWWEGKVKEAIKSEQKETVIRPNQSFSTIGASLS